MRKAYQNIKQTIYQRNAFSVLVVFAALSMAGLATLPALKLQRNPSQPLPQINVRCNWPAATPQITEQQITIPLEGALNTVQGIDKMTSRTTSSSSHITLHVDKDKQLEKVRYEVASVVRRIYPKLPGSATYPGITLQNPDEESSREPVLVYTVQGRGESHAIKQYAEKHLRQHFYGMPQLGGVKVQGGNETAFFLETDTRRMHEQDINRSDILAAIRQYLNRQSVGFALEQKHTEKQVAVVLQPESPEVQWDEIMVKSNNGRLVRLTQVCRVSEKQKQPTSYYRVNGLNAVNILFYPTAGANHLALAKQVKDRVSNLQNLPEGYNIFLTVDNTRFIRGELSKIGWRSAFTVFILLMFVLLVSLSFRYLFVIFISLFVNITASFSLYYLFGIHIHLYSLAGITISLGLIIDNSIVMIDHLRHTGNKRVYLALLASTLTTIASLAIAWFLPEKLKLTLLDFAYIIMINLAVSLVVSLWFIPALLQLYPLKQNSRKLIRRKRRLVWFNRMYSAILMFLVRRKGWLTVAAILIFGIPVFWLPDKIDGEGKWAKTYNQSIGSEWYQQKAAPVVEKALGGGLRLFVNYVYEGSVFRDNQETRLYIYGGLPKGGTLGQLNSVMKEMEAFLVSFQQIEMFTTYISSPQSAYITVRFREKHKMDFPYILKGNVTRKALNFGGMEWSIYGVGQGFYNSPGSSESFGYENILTGYNYDELEKQAQSLKSILEKNPRTAEVNTNMKYSWRSDDYDYVFVLEPDMEQAMLYGTALPAIYRHLRQYDQRPLPAMQVTDKHQLKDVYIVDENQNQKDLYRLRESFVPGDSVRMKYLMDIRKEQVSPDIYKEDQQYIRKVGFRYNGVYKFGRRLQVDALNQLNAAMPMGYRAESREANYWADREQKPYHLLMIVFGMVFIIGAVLFESLRQPFTLIVMILLSFAGVFFTFYGFDLTFDQGGYASFIMLSGLVVNAAIYIINDFNNLGREGAKAYLKAYNYKIIPILLTVVSTIIGLIPFITLGESEPFWFAFSAGTIGGLVFSIPVLFIFLPVFLLKKKRS